MKTSITLCIAIVLSMAACTQHGTVMSYRTSSPQLVRATDQAVLSAAIDKGFAGLDLAALRQGIANFSPAPATERKMVSVPGPDISNPDGTTRPGPARKVMREVKRTPRSTMSAYVQVVSALPIGKATLAYLQERTSLVAGQLGLRVLEVVDQIIPPSGSNGAPLLSRSYPDVDARVVLMVAQAGADDQVLLELQKTHGDKGADSVVIGRFKGTLAVTPRTAEFVGASAELAGESRYEIRNSQFIDRRAAATRKAEKQCLLWPLCF